ncbi:MAG: RNA polymerase sigma factor [Bacteroidota bacterium]
MNYNKEKEFLRLISEHEGLIHKICHVYAADALAKQDLFQEIVIQLWKSFENFRNESKISTWMYRVALNTALSDKRGSKTKVSFVFLDSLKDDTAHENAIDTDQENLNMLYSAISKLTEVEKAIVMLYLDDKSYGEMEDVLGINQGALRVKMNRIKEKLRQITKTSQYGT